MTDKDPTQEPSEETNENQEAKETQTGAESTETVISSPKPKARSRKKAQPAKAEQPEEEQSNQGEADEGKAEAEQAPEKAAVAAQAETVVSAPPAPEPEPEKVAEEPVATIGSEPLPASPPESPKSAPVQPPPYVPPPPQPLSESDERTYAMLAHLSILLNLVTGILGPVAALLIYFVYRDRSRYVRYHAMQSFVFQLIWWLGAGFLAAILWTISGLLAVILVGCLLMPIALFVTLVPLAALVYGVIGAIQTNEHQDFRYWLIGDWVRGELTGN